MFGFGYLRTEVNQHSSVGIELFFKLPSRVIFGDFEIIALERSRDGFLGFGVFEQGQSNYDVHIVRHAWSTVEPVCQRHDGRVIQVSQEPPLFEEKPVTARQMDLIPRAQQFLP